MFVLKLFFVCKWQKYLNPFFASDFTNNFKKKHVPRPVGQGMPSSVLKICL